MRAACTSLLALFLAVGLVACGGSAGAGGIDGATGVRVRLNGDAVPMGEIIIQNVFDPSQTQVLTCNAKDHTLNGLTFCDELVVVPPGVYEVKVELQDPNCTMQQDHYKVQVQAGQTTEVTVNVLCDATNGGLDVIVTETEVPIVTGVTFTDANTGEPANKFVCQCGNPVQINTHVYDSDNICVDLTGTWTATNQAGANVAPSLLINPTSNPDMTLTAFAPNSVSVVNATTPSTVQITFTGTGELASWTDPAGNQVGNATVNWSFTWDGASQTGSFIVTDVNTSQTLLTGTVTGMNYTIDGGTGVFLADMLLQPNGLNFPPAPVVTRFSASTTLAEVVPGDPTNLTGTGIADVFPLQWHGTPDCFFYMTIDTAIALGLYNVTFNLTDPTGLSSSFQIPIHVIDCGLPCQ